MKNRGFTMIEMVMVILLLGVLAAVAIPEFQDFRREGRNAATQGALGGLRSALSVARAAIALKEDTTVATYPTLAEMQANAFDASHPVLTGNAIMDKSAGIPANPWTDPSLTDSDFRSIVDCTGVAQATLKAAPLADRGWCYNATTGQVWANSDRNGAATTENNY